MNKTTVVVPIDFSDGSLSAVDAALEIASTSSGVHVIHVLPELSPVEPGELWETVNDETRATNATAAVVSAALFRAAYFLKR